MSTTFPSCDHASGVVRENVAFESGGQHCDGWLYRPPAPAPHPCVALAHGIGGIRGAALPDFANRFAAAGFAALTFDYRHLGTSAGEPRGLVDIKRQRADYRAAIDVARRLDGIDAGPLPRTDHRHPRRRMRTHRPGAGLSPSPSTQRWSFR